MLGHISFNRWIDFVDYVPIASSAKSLVGMFSKYTYQQEHNNDRPKQSIYSTRRLWSAIPVIGNLVVGGFDVYSCFNPSKILVNYPSILSETSKNDKKFILAAVKQNGNALEFASEELRNDPELVKLAFENNKFSLKFAGRNAVRNIVSRNTSDLNYASDELKNDRGFILEAVKQNSEALEYASDELKNNRDFILSAVKLNGYTLKYASNELKNDREIVLAAVKHDIDALQYASNELKNDRDFILETVKQDGRTFYYASDELKKDHNFILKAVKENGLALVYISDELKKDHNFILKAVKRNGLALKYISDYKNDKLLKNDREIVLTAVEQNGLALEYASFEFKNEREIVLTAVGQNGLALEYASNKLKTDREIVLAAVKQNGLALEYASFELKNDRVIVLAAVGQNGKALIHASDKLRNNPEIVLAAVKQDSLSLEYASKELKINRDFILDVVKQNVESIKFLTSSMQMFVQTEGLTISFLNSQDAKTSPFELQYIQIAKALNQFSNLSDKSLFEALKTLEPNQIDSLLVSIENPKFLFNLLNQDQKVKVHQTISMKFHPLAVVSRVFEESSPIQEIKNYNPNDLIKLFDSLNFSNPNALNYVNPGSIQELKKNIDVYGNKTFDEQKAKALEGLKLMAGHLTSKDGFLGTPNAEKNEELKAYYEYLNLRMGHIVDFLKNSKDSKEIVEVLFILGAAGHACGERYKEEINLIYDQIKGDMQNAGIEGCIKQTLIDLKASFIERYLREALKEKGIEFDLTNPHILGDFNKIKELSGLVKKISFSDPFTALTDNQIIDILSRTEKDYEAQVIIRSLAEKIKRENSFLDLAIDFIKENIPEDFDPETNIWVQRSFMYLDENEKLDRPAAYLSTFYTKEGILRADFMAEELLTNPKLNFLKYLKK